MSNKALNWAWAAKIPAGPKFTLVALADHGADHDGEDWSCFPSPERLMDFTGFPLRTLERHLTWLDQEGWISRISDRDHRGRKTKTTYRLHRAPKPKARPERLAGSTPCEDAPSANMAGGELAAPAAKKAGDQPPESAVPAAKLAGGLYIAEPPSNPQEPSKGVGARELAQWLWGLWPTAGKRGVSSLRQVEAALAAELVDPDWSEAAFRAGARAYVADRKVWGSSGAPKSAHNWVLAGRWQGFDSDNSAGASGQPWAGPAVIRDLVVGHRGEAFAGSYLDVASWNGSAVVARTEIGARVLREVLRGADVDVLDPPAGGMVVSG